MNLPELQQPGKYVGLYIFDFGAHTGVGFTAQEVAELLESERYKNCKVYKIHRAYPDGRLEIKGVRNEIFQLEAGLFFYSADESTARADFKRLTDLAIRTAPPCRAKVHLAKLNVDKFIVALIYPAEYDDEVSSWLLDIDYKTAGFTEASSEAVTRYYDSNCEILARHQLFEKTEFESRTGEQLLANLKIAVQR